MGVQGIIINNAPMRNIKPALADLLVFTMVVYRF